MNRTAACVTLVVQALFGAAVQAQEWVPANGEGAVSLTYENYCNVGHYDVFGRPNTNGGTHSSILLAEFDYALTDKIGVNVTLPFIASKYTGSETYLVGGNLTARGPLDDGTYHGSFQDVRIELRHSFALGPVDAAPFLAVVIPTHGYETVGEAVPGRHRHDFQAGVAAGGAVLPFAPATSFHVRYGFAAAELVNGFTHARSNIEVSGEYAVMRRLVLNGSAGWQITHSAPGIRQLAGDWVHHDRLIGASYTNLGGGLSLALTRSTSLHAAWVQTVKGHDGAHRSGMFASGLTWTFGGGLQGLGGQ